MSLRWTNPQTVNTQDACLDWSRLLQARLDTLAPQRPDGGVLFEPLFVCLRTGTDAASARAALLQAVATDDSLRMDPHERALLEARIADPAHLSGVPDDYALYRRTGTGESQHAALFDVLDCGLPVRLRDEDTPQPATPAAGQNAGRNAGQNAGQSAGQGTPIVAIIDDGIGFLNARFQRHDAPDCASPTRHTRFHAVWLQALESATASGGITAGQVLSRAEIDAMLGKPEGALYATLANALHSGGARPSSTVSTSHGTHVLDLAAGADPLDTQDPVRDWPLLAVQLPPETVDDTSGTWCESYMLQGVRWILRQAHEIDPSAPVIVNLSLGVTAGPKDGARFLEARIAHEAATWEAATGQPVRIVWSFGNSHRANLLAHLPFPAPEGMDKDARDLTVRVQPDDMTASYVEIHTRDLGSEALRITVTAPDGTSTGVTTLAPGAKRMLEGHAGAVAQLVHVPARDTAPGATQAAHYVLALAPTRARKVSEPVAPSGAWKMRIESDAPGVVLCQIQRDDALGGTRMRGRQAYFDHPAAYAWDAKSAARRAPGDACPITPEGGHNALVTPDCRQVFSVGAAQWSGQYPGPTALNVTPSYYTAAGADWSVAMPTASTLADYGPFARGVRAAGTFSGSTRRLGGTSAAAGRLSRALALSAARITANAQNNAPTTQTDDLDPDVLDLFMVAPESTARLGALVVLEKSCGGGGLPAT